MTEIPWDVVSSKKLKDWTELRRDRWEKLVRHIMDWYGSHRNLCGTLGGCQIEEKIVSPVPRLVAATLSSEIKGQGEAGELVSRSGIAGREILDQCRGSQAKSPSAARPGGG